VTVPVADPRTGVIENQLEYPPNNYGWNSAKHPIPFPLTRKPVVIIQFLLIGVIAILFGYAAINLLIAFEIKAKSIV